MANHAAFEARLDFLRDCPPALLQAVIQFPHGRLEDRVAGARAWADALATGSLPTEDCWPPAEIAGPVRAALNQLGVLRFLPDHPELADEVLGDVFEAFERRDGELRFAIAEQLRELETLHRQRIAEQRASHKSKGRDRPGIDSEGPLDMEKLRRLARAQVLARPIEADRVVAEAWQERVRGWSQISEVFGDLGALLGRGADLTRGVLRHTGWKDLVRLAQLLESLDEVREIIRCLGRLQHSDQGEDVVERLFVPMLRLEEELRTRPSPHVPAETRGITRSDDIARMLPAEAALLGHHKLRLLWHARRAERALLTYRVAGTDVERIQVEREVQVEEERRKPRPQRGPIVAVIDTSGSMAGLPERLAKALVLQAMRTAYAEKRRCYLYGYSGPGDVVEQELDLGPDGIRRLLDFLAMSFGGGTDIGAMRSVVRRLDDDDWRKADVMLVTDGEWWAPHDVIEAVRKARAEHGTRFHGVQIGGWDGASLRQLCDPVHTLREWIELQ